MHRAKSCQRPYSLQSCLSLMYHVVHSSFDLISDYYIQKKKHGDITEETQCFSVFLLMLFFFFSSSIIHGQALFCSFFFPWFGELFILNPWVMLHCSINFARPLKGMRHSKENQNSQAKLRVSDLSWNMNLQAGDVYLCVLVHTCCVYVWTVPNIDAFSQNMIILLSLIKWYH